MFPKFFRGGHGSGPVSGAELSHNLPAQLAELARRAAEAECPAVGPPLDPDDVRVHDVERQPNTGGVDPERQVQSAYRERADFGEETSDTFDDSATFEVRLPRLMPQRPGTTKTPGGKRSEPRAAENPTDQSCSTPRAGFTPQQRLLLLDTWTRSGLPAGDFASLVGVSKHTLYAWKKRFEEQGPAGLLDQPRGASSGSRLPELTRRTILMLKTSHPEWGCQRISDTLARGPALGACPSAVAKVLHEAGYESQEELTRPHPDHPRRFERAQPNQLWQTDLFTFMLKRQNRRVYLVAFMDDHSRFIVAYGLHASASTALVREVLEAGISGYGVPEEVLTDNGPQYVSWRGKSQFTRHLEKRGIRQIVAKPRRPQTLGKIERFWGTLWRECVESAIFLDLADARRRIGLFIDHYNFQRPHQGLEGLVPADRFFGTASEVRATLQARVVANALDLARQGTVEKPFYLTGQLEGQPFSVHRAGERLVLTRSGEERQEWEIAGSPESAHPPDANAASLPEPVCPTGNPSDSGTGCDPELGEPPMGLGESPLDEVFGHSLDGTSDGSLSDPEGGVR